MTGPKCPPDKLGALPLYEEQPDQDHDRERHDGGRKRRRVGLQAFDGAEHRDGRRNRAVTIEQGGADEAHHQQFRAPCSGLRMARVEQRQQRDDAAFAAVVRAQNQKRVFDRDDQDQRPQDQRHHAEDGFICQRPAMGGGLGRFLQGVEGTGADVAVDDTEGAECGGCGELSGMAGGCNWRTGHWRPHWHRARRISRGARSTASLRRDAANCHGVPVVGLPIVRKAFRLTGCGMRLLGGTSFEFYRALAIRLVGLLFQSPRQHVQTVGPKENLAMGHKTRHAEDTDLVCLHGLRNQLASCRRRD